MEVGVRLDGLRIEAAAALGDDGLEVGEGGELKLVSLFRGHLQSVPGVRVHYVAKFCASPGAPR